MKRLPLALLPVLSAWGCSNAPEIPPVEIGDGGVRFMNGQSKDPYEAYTASYAGLSPQHLKVRKSLEPRGQNLYGAQTGLERIIDLLERMKSLVTPPYQGRFDPFLAKYREWRQDILRNAWGGSFFQEFEQTEREVKARVSPDVVEIVAEIPKTTEPAVVTPPKPPPVKPDTAPAEPPTQPPPPPPPSTNISSRLLYNAWDKSHDKLVDAYKNKKDCKKDYGDVLEALRQMKAQLPDKRAEWLRYWIGWYEEKNEQTQGFTVLPEKTTEQNVIEDLNVAARVIRKELNPDK